MVFLSKIDSFFIRIMVCTILFVGVVLFLPLYFDKPANGTVYIVEIAIFLFIAVFMFWTIASIRYTFQEKFLIVKGGPIRSRIPYEDITRAIPTRDIYTGYRLLSARYAIDLYYKSAMLGSVKISPQNPSLFLEQLRKHCPDALIESDKILKLLGREERQA
ncbi:PH domain-containing protein [Metabacillus sp. FJAT-52054]|uniref:PH domain-containing protein n=1 Tax=Metabacillus sediminis TaxID=3117746 RepID=A0ABZ2NL45_9BACI